ncbi:signal peptidase I [Neobacillus kokaensis]|uniref:Signal peptidase I n=1 Tax=Neobacillus kokaensis TaxID=2759023 RepID=A0ABQ3NB51_9BACI|nr:signal peptidase I [Neobacillus kokaensis]GHI01147.1 signal peptidase I T [Neobacillus kokaensis]
MSKKELASWGKSILIALGIAFVVRTFLFAPYIVEGSSMEPTLHDEEKMFVSRSVDLVRGDIVIIKGTKENYVKRVIGFPGDKIEVKDDQLFINGKVFKEPYLSHNLKLAQQQGSRLTEDFGPIIVPKNHYFVMGDNRLTSGDSRNDLGYIKEESIVGKTEFVFFPFTDFRLIK